VPGGVYEWQRGRLVWVDRQGNVEVITPEVRAFRYPRVAPDGNRLAFTLEEESDDLWLYDLARGGFTRLTFDARNIAPVWRPGHDEITLSSVGGHDVPAVFSIAADGSGERRALQPQQAGRPLFPTGWSPDGQTLCYVTTDASLGFDILTVGEGGEGPPRPFVATTFDEHMAVFSPDGQWVAYSSDESGRMEVYVIPYPGPGSKTKVSNEGGGEPVWNPAGGELFYRDGDKMMAVTVRTEGDLTVSRPRLLFEASFARRTLAWITNYDVSRDGQRFLMIQEAPRPDSRRIEIVQNWFAEVDRILAEK
ncbi:MAG: hypothetical protein R3344_14935, partial [Acidobacteriota bacterium]|nr:hypothetical protein [Acidobacteriota bacterium]